jgi:hypothetical protein
LELENEAQAADVEKAQSQRQSGSPASRSEHSHQQCDELHVVPPRQGCVMMKRHHPNAGQELKRYCTQNKSYYSFAFYHLYFGVVVAGCSEIASFKTEGTERTPIKHTQIL